MATSTQLTCPHCGSTLTFGMEIAAGTPVECLICMQGFAAQPMAVSAPAPIVAAPSIHAVEMPTMSDTTTTITAPAVSKAKPAPAVGIPVGKRGAETAISAKSASIPTAAKADPAVRAKPIAANVGGKAALLAMALGLAFLLTGGMVFAIVKIVASRTAQAHQTQSADNGKVPVPANGAADNINSAIDPDKTNPDKADPNKADANKIDPPKSDPPAQEGQGTNNAVVSPEEEEQIRNKLREETRQVLKRKLPTGDDAGGGGQLDLPQVQNGAGDKKPALDLAQKKINAAIDKGVFFLKASQGSSGTWNNSHGVGHAAIGGLVFLECQVPAKDPCVQTSARYVRSNVANLTATYELSLAILFLDRLGEPRDRPLIQGMAMRLIAGQTEGGGWSYQCPALTSPGMLQLFNFLHANRKPNLLDPLQGNVPAGGALANPLRDPLRADPNFDLAQNANARPMPAPKKGKNQPKMAPMPVPNFPNFQNLPVVRNQGAHKGKMMLRQAGGDNSNTQFALLALWAARRHDVPSESALLAAFQRFTTSQNNDGGWPYRTGGGSTNTMTCVGLLGMALGHGASPEIIRFNPQNPKDFVVKPALQDPRIQTGLRAMARNIGEPSRAKNPNLPMQNLYFLWSVERVGVLYDLKTIGGKDWYGWGSQILVANQQPNGAWPTAHYHGANPPLNTCFALLFLKRSNLVQDLTNNLRLYNGIRESENK